MKGTAFKGRVTIKIDRDNRKYTECVRVSHCEGGIKVRILREEKSYLTCYEPRRSIHAPRVEVEVQLPKLTQIKKKDKNETKQIQVLEDSLNGFHYATDFDYIRIIRELLFRFATRVNLDSPRWKR